MPSTLIFGACLAIQALVIGVDEFYFHFKRGLPKWERVGHPVDTFSVILVFAAFNFTHYDGSTPAWLWGLMIFSSALITKDEWIHHEYCEAAETWLHSLLFLIHPLVFISGWLLWRESGPHFLHRAQGIGLCLFLIYQIVYWNWIAAEGVKLEKRSQ